MMENALWRYLIASSGLANCAEAGAAMASKVAAAAIQIGTFMFFLGGFFHFTRDGKA
jgi:hypothetical protein